MQALSLRYTQAHDNATLMNVKSSVLIFIFETSVMATSRPSVES